MTLMFLLAVTVLMCYENYWNLIAIIGEYPVAPGVVPPVPFPEHEGNENEDSGQGGDKS